MCIQVIQARGLQAAESKGCSSPYCRMRLGSHKVQTNVVRNSLSPRWSETFVFPASNVEACLLGGTPKVICELWDRNALGADDFLGQVRYIIRSYKPAWQLAWLATRVPSPAASGPCIIPCRRHQSASTYPDMAHSSLHDGG